LTASAKTVAVLGAGNGGQALAGHLSILGHRVRLFEHPDFRSNVNAIAAQGYIELHGAVNGKGKIEMASSDAAEVMDGIDAACMVAPSFAQEPLLEILLPHWKKGAPLLMIPGNFGSFIASKMAMSRGIDEDACPLAETDTLPYACRLDEPGRVHVWGVKSGISFSALPSSRNEEMARRLGEFFPIPLEPLENVLAIGMSNLNMVVHCAAMLLNTGRIESTGGDFRFYTDGITPTVGKLQELMDAERRYIAEGYDLDLVSAIDWIHHVYGIEGDTLYELLTNNPAYSGHGSDAPKTVRHRYITEDVPNLLAPLLDLGRAAGRKAPVTESVVCLLSNLLDEDYRLTGRTMDRLGIGGMDVESVLKRVNG